MKQELAKKQKIKGIVTVSVIAAALIAAYAIGISETFTDSAIEQKKARPTPPPAPLEMWGNEVDSDLGKKQLGFDKLSTPLNIPDGLVLKSTRTIVSEDRTYRQFTQFFGPTSADTSDKALIDDFLRNGGLMIVYVEDDRAKPFDWKTLGSKLVEESPNKRELGKLNDADALIIKGDKAQKDKSEVMFDIGRTRIAIVSNSYDANQLIPIAQSIRG